MPDSTPTSPERRIPMLVTVILPFRDAATFLPKQLDALANQDYDDRWELVVCDDRSCDDSLALIESAATRHGWSLAVVEGRGEGPGPARNAAAARARGDLLCFCDADDLVDVAWLRELVLAAGKGDFVAGRLDRQSLNEPLIRLSRGSRETATRMLAASCNLAVWREVFDALGGFDPGFKVGEDTDLTIRAHLAGYNVTAAPDAVVAYRYRAGSAGIFRQQRLTGRYGRFLRRRYPDMHTLLPARSSPVRQLFWLGLRSPYLATRRRGLWYARLGLLLGDLEGRWRALPPARAAQSSESSLPPAT